jgi:stage II sporulation protein R
MNRVLQIFKGVNIGKKYSLAIKIAGVLVLTSIITTSIVFASYSENVNEGLSDNLIRLHVIANSDSAEDQALKRDVRDKILSFMKEPLTGSKNLEETKNIIKNNLSNIENIARNDIISKGKKYDVKVVLGNYAFPTKTYGDIALPAGIYQALRIVIGKGEGANWWCVLFPPLCFVDATHGTVPDSVKQKLKDTLTDEEYNVITTADSDDDIPIKIKFKVVEFFQSTKVKFSGLVSKIFKSVG